jgi:hypothetical protein
VDVRELLRKIDFRPLGLREWASQFSLFTLAVLFALSGHLLFAGFLNMLAALGVDFTAIDKSRNLVPALQVLLFAIETGLVVWAIAKVGIPMKKTLAGIAAMFWAAAMLMITFVSAQCDLYGACL